MALCSWPSSRFILHSANALALVSVKVQEARKFPDIKIVSFDWLTASIKSHIRADEDHFSFSQTDSDQDEAINSKQPMPSAKNDNKGKGKKRPRSPTPTEEVPSDAEDSAEQMPTKKHRDVQRATSSSLLIPVDETCPLAGKTCHRKLFWIETLMTGGHRNSSSIHWHGWNDLRCGIEPDKCRSK